MKMYLISDNIDTQIGMRLVGIDGCVAHDSETITAEIKKAVNDPELGILISDIHRYIHSSARLHCSALQQFFLTRLPTMASADFSR